MFNPKSEPELTCFAGACLQTIFTVRAHVHSKNINWYYWKIPIIFLYPIFNKRWILTNNFHGHAVNSIGIFFIGPGQEIVRNTQRDHNPLLFSRFHSMCLRYYKYLASFRELEIGSFQFIESVRYICFLSRCL